MGKVVLDEQASPGTPGAGKGTIYVKNDVPSTAQFIDDTGAEFQLGAAGSVPTGTGFRHVTAGAEDAASELVGFADATHVAANQGTTTTLLHGNAAGQVSFGAVVTADISDEQITLAKLVHFKENSLLGKDTLGTGDPLVMDETDIATVSPAGADFILGWTAAGLLRKYTVTSLPAGGEVNDLAADGINNIADDQIAIGSGASTAAYHTLPNGAVTYATGTNTVSQAALADLSDVTAKTGTGTIVVMDTTPTIVTPTIASFVNATHDHQAAAGGGTLDINSATTGILAGAQGGTNNGFMDFTGPATSLKTFTLPNATSTILTDNADVTVAQGGTGLSVGTDGGILGFTGTTTLASSALLVSNGLMLGGGAGATPSTLALGTAFQHLRMNSGATAPEWAVDTKSKAFTIEDPTAADTKYLWQNEAAITVLGVSFAGSGGTDIAFEIEFGTDLTGGTVIHADTLTITTPEYDVTPSGTAAVPTDRIIVVDIGTVTGSVTDLGVTIHYRENV